MHIRRRPIPLLALGTLLLLAASHSLAAWKAEIGTVKVHIRKRLAISATGQAGMPIPASLLQKWNAVTVDDQDSYMVVQLPSANASRFRADLQGIADFVHIRDDFDIVHLVAGALDARLPEPRYPAEYTRLPLPSPARDAFILQFASVPRQEWLDQLRAAGASVVAYVAQNAYIVIGTATSVQQIADRTPVQMLRLYQPFHRLSSATRVTPEPMLDAVVSIANVTEAADARAFLEANVVSAGPVQNLGDSELHSVSTSTSALPQLVGFPAVIWIEPRYPVVLSGEREARLVIGDTLVTNSGTPLILQPVSPPPAGDNGYRDWIASKALSNYPSVVKVAILDTGFDAGTSAPSTVHRDFRSSETTSFVTVANYTSNDQGRANNDCNGHGTMVAGVLAGNAGLPFTSSTLDSGFWMGIGVAPAIPLVSGRVFNYLDG